MYVTEFVVTVAATEGGFVSLEVAVCLPVDVAYPHVKLSYVNFGAFAEAFAAVTLLSVTDVPILTHFPSSVGTVSDGAEIVDVNVPYAAVATGFGHFSTQNNFTIKSCNDVPAGIVEPNAVLPSASRGPPATTISELNTK